MPDRCVIRLLKESHRNVKGTFHQTSIGIQEQQIVCRSAFCTLIACKGEACIAFIRYDLHGIAGALRETRIGLDRPIPNDDYPFKLCLMRLIVCYRGQALESKRP